MNSYEQMEIILHMNGLRVTEDSTIDVCGVSCLKCHSEFFSEDEIICDDCKAEIFDDEEDPIEIEEEIYDQLCLKCDVELILRDEVICGHCEAENDAIENEDDSDDYRLF